MGDATLAEFCFPFRKFITSSIFSKTVTLAKPHKRSMLNFPTSGRPNEPSKAVRAKVSSILIKAKDVIL
jgi:hypothetical protein